MEQRTAQIGIRCTARLRAAAVRMADHEQITLAALVEKALAEYVGKPKLSEVPRPSLGRPRKEVP